MHFDLFFYTKSSVLDIWRVFWWRRSAFLMAIGEDFGYVGKFCMVLAGTFWLSRVFGFICRILLTKSPFWPSFSGIFTLSQVLSHSFAASFHQVRFSSSFGEAHGENVWEFWGKRHMRMLYKADRSRGSWEDGGEYERSIIHLYFIAFVKAIERARVSSYILKNNNIESMADQPPPCQETSNHHHGQVSNWP